MMKTCAVTDRWIQQALHPFTNVMKHEILKHNQNPIHILIPTILCTTVGHTHADS